MSSAKNIIEKIWQEHTVSEKEDFPDILAIDLHLIHEVTSPQAFDELQKRNLSVFDPDRCIATVDHIVSTTAIAESQEEPIAAKMLETLRENVAKHNIRLLDRGSGNQGIVHVIGPELGLTQPGMTIVCGDSHTSTHGAFGALAFGIGTTEVANVLATGCLLRNKPKSMRVIFSGSRPSCISAKDMILKLIQTIGIGGATGHIIEYAGDVISTLSMEERMTLCNMSIECGARAGLIAPDETTFRYLRSKAAAPKGTRWFEAIEYWQSLASDENARYDKEVSIDISKMSPVVTWGTNPAQSIEIGNQIPDPRLMEATEADLANQSLEYTRLKPGMTLEGVPVDYVFIGSCTNGRISDLRVAAEILKGRSVADGVVVNIVPGSEEVRKQSISEGLDEVFRSSGADFRLPGCSMCLAMNEDKVPPGKRCASTSNRNFVGRQGAGSITHLMSPQMAAAAAVTGKITDVRELLREGESR